MRNTLLLLLALCLVPALFAQGGPVQTVTVTLTSAQLQHLGSAHVQLLAAPGTGNVLSVISAVAQYKAGSTPYTVQSGRLNLFLGDPGNVVVASAPAAGFLDQPANQVRLMPQSAGGDAQANYENQPLMAANDGGSEWTSGDGSVVISVTYTVVALQ